MCLPSYNGLTNSNDSYFLLISVASAKKKASKSPYGEGQWFCEPDNKDYCHIYVVEEAPFYGLGDPHWVLTVDNMKNGATAIAFYGTYAACHWNEERKQAESENQRVTYNRWATEHHQDMDDRVEVFHCARVPR